MRAVIQRAHSASVIIDNTVHSEINSGLLIFLGIEENDSKEDSNWLCTKISQMRIFPDQESKMNLSIKDTCGEALVVSQFTLHASTKKGNRPSFIKAASPDKAEALYEYFKMNLSTEIGKEVQSGVFGAMMDVELVNSGPVTILIDSKNRE